MKIELRNLSFYYKQFGANSNHRPALDHINLSIDHHELVAIVGPSGSGKTTLVQMMNGLLEPDEGHVAIDGAYVTYKGDLTYP